ncbi:putative protein FAR1-RELATED SEQUENCE 10 [Bienertia sinuspersici]
MEKQYGILKPYLLELVKSNLKTTCVLKTLEGEDGPNKKPMMHKRVVSAGGMGDSQIERRTCSCRSWDMTGVPCAHAMSAILYMNQAPEEYLADWYKLPTYKAAYSSLLNPVPGLTYWNQKEGLVLPPDIVKSNKRGRKQTTRRKDLDEPKKNTTKYSRKGMAFKCGNYGGT